MVVDTDARVVVANEAAAAIIGVSLDELMDRPLSAVPVDLLDDRGHLLAPEQLPLPRALRGEEVTGHVVRVVRRDGSLLWVEIHANPLHHDDGQLYGAVASLDDVTARVEQDRRTRHEADTDPLTGLANRRALERTLDVALTRASARARAVALLMLDLDGFKAVNDTHGHAAGDEALREVARRLTRSVRERDLVARFGGDEFVVVLTDLGGRSGAVRDSMERITEALTEPIAFNGASVTLGAAMGVATFPADGGTAADLLAHADRGMYAAKAARDGSLLWVEVHANPLHHDDGQLYGAVASYDDVTARVEQDRRTRHEADTDPLTGLANRRALERTLDAALSRAGARARSVGLLMLDLDGFKAINDTRGHAAGDAALREVAARLRRCVRERDLVARLGGDEFVIVLTDLDHAARAVADLVDRVRDGLAAPFAEQELKAAIGVALYPSEGATAADLLAHADRAMYVDKGARNGSFR